MANIHNKNTKYYLNTVLEKLSFISAFTTDTILPLCEDLRQRSPAKQVIAKHIINTRDIPVVSNVRCVRLYRRKYGFGLNFKYLYRSHTIMEERENGGFENMEDDDDDISGSDADASDESSDTSSSKDEDDTVDKVFVKWVAPGGPADQAGLMKGDEVISLNNSAVYGKHSSDIDNVIQRSNAIDVDVVEDPAKRKGKVFQRYRGNGYEVHVVHRGSQDEHSDNESSENDATTTGDRYFVVTYGKASETTDNKPGLHPFLRPFSYSDDEPQMENKSVSISVGGREAKSEDATGRTQSNRYLQVNHRDGGASSKRNKIPGKRFALTSSTSSSVLVESQDNGSTPEIPTCVTITTATLAEPQSARTDVGSERSENVSTSCSNHGLLVSEENGNVWELRVPEATHIRPRSPSPAQRRVSYLMATEGDASLTSGDWEFKSIANGGDTDDGGLSACEEEINVFQSGNEMSNEEHRTVLHIPRGESLEDDEDDDDNEHTDPEVLNEGNRHSLKRKCSVECVEVDKEGYLKRKYGANHGRRSWKQVYVVLKAHIMYISKDKPYQMMQGGQDEKPISIKSCIVDIAYDYRKRENVFKLTTYNASQYLFQAKDKDDMMSWIGIIQKNNNPDEDTFGRTSEELIVRRKKNMDIEISSQTTNKSMPPTSLKIGGLKKSLSFKINSGREGSFKIKKAIDGDSGKATWHSKVVNKVRRIGNTTSSPVPQYQAQGFSAVASLERCPKSKANSYLPLLVEHCCQVVENRALESVGIYRVPGNSAMVTALEEELIKSPDGVDFEDPKWNDANNMASLLRNFLRKLPEGLVTSELYGKFINANRVEGEDRMWSLKRLIQQLPSAYGETLRFIIGHIKKVSEHSDKNKMEVRNLAIVFGPTIVRTGEDNMTTMVNDMTDRFRIVESFINHCDWFFDNEPFSDGELSSPVSPPAEAFSPLLVSSKAMNSIQQSAVNYEADPPWKSKGGKFKNFLRTQSSDSSKSSESSKKYDLSPDGAASPEPLNNGKGSPINLSPNAVRFGGNSQPSSPSTSRRKFIKRHHSSTNVSTAEVHDDFDRSKSEGEEEDYTFHPRPSHSTKAYSYARPPPPSYRESRNKGSIRAPAGGSPPQPSNKDVAEPADFNSLSDGTKLRLLNFTLRSKVNEKQKQQNEVSSPVTTQSGIIVNSQNDSVTVTVPRKLSNSSQAACSTSEEQAVVTEQLKPSEAKKRFEQRSDTKTADESSSVKPFSSDAVRRRDGSSSSSSSRNFKIYSKGDVPFSQCQINEWMGDLGLSSRGGSERGRARAKTEDLGKTMRRSSSVSRTSFTHDEEEIMMKRKSLSCQDINIEDEDVINRTRTLSNSSDSTESSGDEEEEDPLDASSKAFDEKLRGLMQKCKLDSKSKTELQPGRKASQVSRPPSYRVSRTSVEKMRAVDPGSNIQSGAVNSMKSLFESGAAHQNIVKARSSSVSSASSGSVLSNGTPRNSTCSTTTVSDADVERRVWKSDTGTGRQFKEPEWVARERAMKNLHSESESSIKGQPDDNNNLPTESETKISLSSSKPSYSRSTSLPIRDCGYVVKDVTVEQKRPAVRTQVVRKYSTNDVKTSVESPTIQRAAVKNGPTIRKITPASSVKYKPQSKNQPVDVANKNTGQRSLGRTQKPTQNSPFRSTAPSQESASPPASPPVVNFCTNNSTALSLNTLTGPNSNSSTAPSSNTSTASSSNTSTAPSSNTSTPPSSSQKQISTARSRRRIVSDTTRRAPPESRQIGRTFTAPILGTIVTTTTAFELSAFAIKPESTNRAPKARCVRRSEKQNNGRSPGEQTRTSIDMHTPLANLPRTSLTIPNSSSPPDYGSPSMRRKAIGLAVPEMDQSKRLSTDRTLLEQNALHIKELLDEMNTEHSQKMERQKSDTISINAQKAARHRARIRRRSLGQDRDTGVVVASRVSPGERNRADTQAPRSATSDLPRNLSNVEWVGVSS